MRKEQFNNLPLGLYKVYWKNPSESRYSFSLAALGNQRDGDRWLAPCNWTAPTMGEMDGDGGYVWESIEQMELLMHINDGKFFS